MLTSAPGRLTRYGAVEIKSTPRDSCPPWGGDRRDSGYETWQLGVTFGDLGLCHTARGGEERRQTSACLMLLLWEILSRGKNLQILQFAEPRRHPAGERLMLRHPELAAQPGPGESSTGRDAPVSSLQLVPPTAIWKDLSSRLGAKEQLAYTLLPRPPPSRQIRP